MDYACHYKDKVLINAYNMLTYAYAYVCLIEYKIFVNKNTHFFSSFLLYLTYLVFSFYDK